MLQLQSALHFCMFHTHQIQPTTDGKYLGKKFQKVTKSKTLSRAGNYLYSIYIVLGIINNLEMI